MNRGVLVNEKHLGGEMKKTNINSQEMLFIQRLNLPILYKIRNDKGVRLTTKPSSVVTKSMKKRVALQIRVENNGSKHQKNLYPDPT